MAAGAPFAQTIPPDPPADVAQNFSALLDIGLAAASAASGDVWTDYNAHDPGVTILEALAYALTDVGYRIGHPIEDLIASATAEGGASIEQQPLFTGDRILTGAPHSADDLRKLVYDQILGLRNLWLEPIDTDALGADLFQPVVQCYNGVGGDEFERILRETADQLNANRPLGVDFRYPKLADLRELFLDADIAIDREAVPETVLADVLYRIEQRINPAPQLRDVERDMEAGEAAEVIFDGPRLEHGWISDATLAPYAVNLRVEDIADAILSAPGVTGIGAINQPDDSWIEKAQSDRRLIVLSRDKKALAGLRVLRDGVRQSVDAARVLTYLNHLEESVRWAAGYASHQTKDLEYARVPLGNAKRKLGRYRSIHRLFPPIYRLGPERVDRERGGREDARRMQLKAYLLFFEQTIANALSQISRTTSILSFAEQDRSYFSAPVAPPGGAPADAPPDIGPILGALDEGGYAAALEALEKRHDPLADRLNAARDAMLARFGTRLPDNRLARIWDRAGDDPETFQLWLAKRKRERIEHLPDGDGRRGVGANPASPAPTEIERAIACISGHEGMISVVDHILLRPCGPDFGIGEMEIRNDSQFSSLPRFRVFPHPPFRAARLENAGFCVHLVARDRNFPDAQSLAGRLIDLADSKSIRVSAPDGYASFLALTDGVEDGFDVLEAFTDPAAARRAAARIVAIGQGLRRGEIDLFPTLSPATLPLDFYRRRVSFILAPGDEKPKGPEYQGFVEDVIRTRAPAHLHALCYWLESAEAAKFQGDFDAWRRQLQKTRQTPEPPEAARLACDVAASVVQGWIERLHARELRDRRAALVFEALP